MPTVDDDIRGERVLMKTPDQKPNLIPHGLAYVLALPHVQGKKVLEVGCGTGYGTKLLAESAQHIIGIDYSTTAIGYASQWKPGNCEFLCKDAETDLPLKSFDPDVIVAMQALEHIDKPRDLISKYRDKVWVFALPNGGESVDHHHHSVSELLIEYWFGKKVPLRYFDDWGNIYDTPDSDFTNFFGVYSEN